MPANQGSGKRCHLAKVPHTASPVTTPNSSKREFKSHPSPLCDSGFNPSVWPVSLTVNKVLARNKDTNSPVKCRGPHLVAGRCAAWGHSDRRSGEADPAYSRHVVRKPRLLGPPTLVCVLQTLPGSECKYFPSLRAQRRRSPDLARSARLGWAGPGTAGRGLPAGLRAEGAAPAQCARAGGARVTLS